MILSLSLDDKFLLIITIASPIGNVISQLNSRHRGIKGVVKNPIYCLYIDLPKKNITKVIIR
jgi:hypothetical protein